ncbi:MAG: hypothetical protein H0Z38_00450 [Firmicutes bacterium]|nr:hypothetical protein [Bacillota bacterium]
MRFLNKVRKFCKYLGWGSALASLVWGVLFYLRFNNPVVDAFHDIPAQLAALESAAATWKTAGSILIAVSVVSLIFGYLRMFSGELKEEEKEAHSAKKNVVEGT